MKKLLCVTAAAFLLCVSCSSVQVPEDNQPQDSIPVSVTHPASDTFTTDNSEVQLAKTDEAEITQIDRNTLDEIITAVGEVITKYNDGTIVESDRIQPPPTDYIFDEDIKVENSNVYYSEVMGEYKITLSSLNNKWDAVFFANNFIYVDSDGNTSGGSFVVTDVIFIEKQN